MDLVQIIGLCGVCTTIMGLFPQVVKTFKEKSVKDLSIFMILMLMANSILWTTYGILKDAEAVTWANIAFFANTVALLFFKLKYQHHPNNQ